MRSCIFTGLACCVFLIACSDSAPKQSKDDEQIFDAVMYAFTGIEDNTKDSYGLTTWRRDMKSKVLRLWKIGKNGIGTSDKEENKKIRNSKYVRYVHRLTNPDPCVFRFDDITEFSNGDSNEDFSAYSMTNSLNSHVFNFANAHKFEFVDNGWGTSIIVLEGPRVVCSDGDRYCENAWTSEVSGMAYNRFDNDKESVSRRRRAIDVIKKACPGRAF